MMTDYPHHDETKALALSYPFNQQQNDCKPSNVPAYLPVHSLKSLPPKLELVAMLGVWEQSAAI